MSEVLRTEQGRFNETDPIGPKRFYVGDREIPEARFVELMAQRAREIEAGEGGLVD